MNFNLQKIIRVLIIVLSIGTFFTCTFIGCSPDPVKRIDQKGGAIFGGIFCGVIGFILGIISGKKEMIIIGALVGAVLGAFVGGVIGWMGFSKLLQSFISRRF